MRKFYVRLLACMMLWLSALSVHAQQAITGTVSDGQSPLPGVTITVKGKDLTTQTDVNGKFSIQAITGDVLVLRFIGYGTKEVVVGSGSTELAIDLSSDVAELGEVVVTALGIKKERKALGYAVTEVKGEELTQARENNFINSLSGKVAGLSIGATSGGPGSSSNVLIRGVSSIGQSSQPLYVINGVPMESRPNSTAGPRNEQGSQWDNSPDLGDAISNINPDDIESISVLKGAAASALYGYRAKAGVIMITTKSGVGSGIEFSSNYVAEQIMNLTDWQYVYGQGANNAKPISGTAAAQVGGSSWGGRLDGTMVPQFDGVERPYSAVTDNLNNFYRTGSSWTNTIALNKSFTGGSIRLSGSNLDNRSVVPNSGLDRQTFNFSGIFDPIKNLKIDTRVNYIIESANNRAMLSDGAGNGNFQSMFLPTSLDINTLKPGTNPDGTELAFNTGNAYATNPWFATEKFINDTKRERLISSVTARYDFDGGYYVQGRVGRDHYVDRYKNVVPTGTAYRPDGSMLERTTNFTDMNADFLAGNTFVAGDFSISPAVGASYRRTESDWTTNNGTAFNVPFVYNILNIANKSVNYQVSDEEVQSLYGNVELSFRDYLYLTGSVRSDWFSTLATPGYDNALNIVYPSVNASFVFSELWKPSYLSFGKLRAGYARVGQAGRPYQTQLNYNFLSESVQGFPLGTISNSAIPNFGLVASSASELEIGAELSLFDNLISLDATWYNKKSSKEIVEVATSSSTGYTGAVLNSGEMQNKGFELLLTANIFRNSNGFSWTSAINGAINENEILSLAEGTNSQLVGTSRSGYGFVQQITGLPAFQVMAYDYQYDDGGNIVYQSNGIPVRGELKPFGSALHKWMAGWNNDFSYKRVNLSFLLDGKWGGKIYSGTDYYGYQFGLHKATLENREGNFATDGSTIEASTYYSQLSQNVSMINVQDASFIKLRQIIIGYTFPSFFNNTVKSLNISAVARNPFILMRKTDNIDPEGSYTATVPGLELGGIPAVRTFGLNLSAKF